MGNIKSGIDYRTHPEVTPHPKQKSNFDPLYGFPDGRPEKVKKYTNEEMESAKIPADKRDYCAHILLDYMACRKKNFPFVWRCHHEKHHYLNCQHDEYIDRMKDYERERRLMEREKRLGRPIQVS